MAEKIEATLEEKLDRAAHDLLATSFRPGTPPDADKAMKLTQALLNLGHAKQLLCSKK